MFVRLTRHMRRKAGWFAALLYLFCVLAPGAALALGDAASCLQADIQTEAAAHVHGDAHASHHADAISSHAGHDHAQHEHHGKASPGPCCAMLCLSAIATELPALAKPSQPISVRLLTDYRSLPDEALARHYRPPIA
jgi:hypothetical protein